MGYRVQGPSVVRCVCSVLRLPSSLRGDRCASAKMGIAAKAPNIGRNKLRQHWYVELANFNQ
eukprot:14909640-Alexandrium_andersonii.AAC.1